MKGLLESLKTRMGGAEESESDDGVTSGNRPSTTLYSCPDCETTYVSEDLESCPQCDGALDTTPNEYELGIGPGSGSTSPRQ